MIKYMAALLALFLNVLVASAQITWGMQMNVAPAGNGNFHPRIDLDASGNPMVIWNYQMKVMFSKWTGTAFTAPVMINPANMMVAGANWMGPGIASRGDTVYVVFKLAPEVDTSSHIYVVRSFDGGATFSTPFQVDQIADSVSRFPAVTIDNDGHPVVAFMKFNPMLMEARWVVARSSDYGTTFSPDVKASGWGGSGAVCDCCPGAMTTEGNNVFMVYRDNNNNIRDIWAGISNDNGATFPNGMPVDQNTWQNFSCPGSGPDGVAAGDSLYSVYMSSASGSARVYYSTVSATLMSGGYGDQITGTFAGLGTQNYPRIATDGTAMGIVWKQTVSGVDQAAILFTNDKANGFQSGWDTVDLSHVTNVDIAVGNGRVTVVWQDDNTGTIRYRMGTFNSTTSLTENLPQAISGFPSATNDVYYLQGMSEAAGIVITDVSGRICKTERSSGEKHEIRMRDFADGVYYVRVETTNGLYTTKIIKY